MHSEVAPFTEGAAFSSSHEPATTARQHLSDRAHAARHMSADQAIAPASDGPTARRPKHDIRNPPPRARSPTPGLQIGFRFERRTRTPHRQPRHGRHPATTTSPRQTPTQPRQIPRRLPARRRLAVTAGNGLQLPTGLRLRKNNPKRGLPEAGRKLHVCPKVPPESPGERRDTKTPPGSCLRHDPDGVSETRRESVRGTESLRPCCKPKRQDPAPSHIRG